MATQDAPYDPYIPNSQQQQQGGNQQGGNARTQALQAVSFPMHPRCILDAYIISLLSLYSWIAGSQTPRASTEQEPDDPDNRYSKERITM